MDRILSKYEEESASSVEVTSTVVEKRVKRVYAPPKSSSKVGTAIKARVLQNTQKQTAWCNKVWEDWATARNSHLLEDEEPFSISFVELPVVQMDFCLSRLVLKV